MRFAVLLPLAIAGAAACGGSGAVGAQPVPLTDLRCRLVADALPAAYGECGHLPVPLNPAAPEGRTIELFVARIPALGAEPRADPLLLITGGPGQSTVDFYLEQRGAFESSRLDRDLILVDQRGTGRSAEGFGCSVPEELSLDTAGAAELGRLVDDCVVGLREDPRYYTTSVAVQDLERVRTALGIERWNLYGVSYGTRVAQHYLRRYPERTRSVVLDGVVPPPLALGPDVAREAQRALEQIFERCAADAQCGERFGNLADTFSSLLARLDEAEGTSPPPLRAVELRTLVRFMSYNVTTVALLPILIDEAHGGNYEPLAKLARSLLRDLPEALSFPMSNSVTCTEDVRFADGAVGEDLRATYLGTAIVDALRLICERWPVGVMDEDFKAPVESDAPALLLSGEFDPITPPSYAERVMTEGLRNSVHLVGRGQGHGLVRVGCMPRVLRQFLASPRPAELDASCLEAEPPTPFFLSLQGPGP
jgi:pimeloyl-ACP methyl ester carboxylesterase